ncbi:MAG: 2-hydroxyglutaryl-CoA dehydratase, partial [Spirochaetales bacterium]|nr:2-hydroxyglutaryl-CoA dehydratase [Spirochaetales bacterium]
MKLGLDIGSTTIKCTVLDDNNRIIHQSYDRHYSRIIEQAKILFNNLAIKFPDAQMQIAISGSAGMGIADSLNIPFIQEVYATKVAAEHFAPGTDTIIELGGEDAKILFLTGNLEVRMNGSCAGGTGAFIDQMSTLLNLSVAEMNEQARNAQKIYTIASRCGVFAKSDIQPLLNQGALKSDISASIFAAVVNQTIAGLAQGRPIEGNILYLGGPLTFISELRKAFDTALGKNGVCPENSLYFVAIGSAMQAATSISLSDVIQRLDHYKGSNTSSATLPALFKNEAEYQEFVSRHEKDQVPCRNPDTYNGDVFLGIDAGSTTIKMTVINKDREVLLTSYQSNSGNPIPHVQNFLENLYTNYPHLHLAGAAVTGYGEEIIKNAFLIDENIVETVAHFTAAKAFLPDVEFIIDIGGQDIKCFKIANGTIDNIFLNEACSSGCGSFLQTFASALGHSISDFAKFGLKADHPVDLGSRCTVFMNSSVKQAQKDGATIENISAGLSISVVKNALYKVIRVGSANELGTKIVVQGGTFLNDAVLRAFEQELGINVVRPSLSGLMGAYGAALYAAEHVKNGTTVLSAEQLKTFKHEVKAASCGLCNNHCQLTINTFGNDRKFIGGNRCERPVTKKDSVNNLDMYQYKLELLQSYCQGANNAKRGKIGIPMGLNFYELLPFWNAFFTALDFEPVTSGLSNRALFLDGQHTIPSDTVCFPAKLLHGHIRALINKGINRIFYPCMSYNLNENLGDNHYNCPVVAYYPEVINANMPEIKQLDFKYDYLGIHRKKDFPKKVLPILQEWAADITLKDVQKAT